MPSPSPTSGPTRSPTSSPTSYPTSGPTALPSNAPTMTSSPTSFPTTFPTRSPTQNPSSVPTWSPTEIPSSAPTSSPSYSPSPSPSMHPTSVPSMAPTCTPTFAPSYAPTNEETNSPSAAPVTIPTANPTNGFSTPESHKVNIVRRISGSLSEVQVDDTTCSLAKTFDAASVDCSQVSIAFKQQLTPTSTTHRRRLIDAVDEYEVHYIVSLDDGETAEKVADEAAETSFNGAFKMMILNDLGLAVIDDVEVNGTVSSVLPMKNLDSDDDSKEESRTYVVWIVAGASIFLLFSVLAFSVCKGSSEIYRSASFQTTKNFVDTENNGVQRVGAVKFHKKVIHSEPEGTGNDDDLVRETTTVGESIVDDGLDL